MVLQSYPVNLKYKFLLYIFLIVQLFCPFNGLAQDCGCVGCPRVIPVANADFTIDYVVKGLLNDDLAGNQCVASVNIQFRHNRLQNLAIELISPSGQVVPLIGPIFPFGGGLGGTFGASWNVNFVQCFPNALAQPDPGVEEIWYNLDPAWSVFGGSFSGTYYPSEGFCLEEFNDGSANGTWQLRVQNEGFPPSPGAGLIENFTITFCDPTGEGCCAADGGTLPINRITACEGDTSLFVNLQPFFTVDKPDTSIYDYRYLIVRNDSIIAISSSVNLTNYSSAFYVVYGLSFQRSMIDEVDASVGLTISELEALGLCLDLSDNELVIEIIASPPSTDLVQTICQGDSVLVVNIWFSQTGEYFISTLASNGCDSLVHLDLRVLPSLETNLTASICDGESYLFGNRTLTQSGAYVDSLQSISGCDSLVRLDLQVLPSLEANLTASICTGESYLFGNRTLTQSGAYVDSLQSISGCDSLVRLDLRVISLLADVALALPECNAKDSASIQVLNVRGGTTPYLYSINNQPFNASQRFDNLPSGDYQLVVQDVSGCEWDTLITIPNFSLLEVELGEDIIISPGTPTDIVLTTNQPLTTIRWRASTAEVINCENCTSITVQPNAPTTYFVTAINEQGCTASDDIRVFLEQLSIIYIPNAFSPNGDGENDQFFIQVRPQAVNRVLSFQIFDRWGNIVYELFDFSPDASFTWDGFYKGKIMNPAVFIYNIEIELADGTRKRLVGDFLLTK